jgi:hypothetical protein
MGRENEINCTMRRRNFYSSPNIIKWIKSERMIWAGHVARMKEERKIYKVLMGKPNG